LLDPSQNIPEKVFKDCKSNSLLIVAGDVLDDYPDFPSREGNITGEAPSQLLEDDAVDTAAP
jgi:hypothetical protein